MRRRTLVGLGWLGVLGMAAALAGCAGGQQEEGTAQPPPTASLADAKPAEAKPDEAAKPPEADAKAPDEAPAPEATPPAPEAPPTEAPPAADPAAPEAAPETAPTAPAADPAAPTGPVIVKRQLQLEHERIGELHYGMTAEEVVAVLGEPAKKTKLEMEEATAEYVSFWQYPDHDIEVGMRAKSRKGKQLTVRSLDAGPACTLPGPWGLAIGSTRDEVKKVYGKHYDRTHTDSQNFVAGSIYGGTMYTFKKGKVVSIFVGAAAE